MKKLAALDLEIWKIIPEEETDWAKHEPLGISCLAVLCEGGLEYVFQSPPNRPMTKEEVDHMMTQIADISLSHDIVTWNGLSFDWRVLCNEGLEDARPNVARLARNHIDLMFIVLCRKGHYLSLAKAAEGMKVSRKIDSVKLTTGEDVHITGAEAPVYWQRGETKAILEYLRGDVRATLEVAMAIRDQGYLRWLSNSGRNQSVSTGLHTVAECLDLPRPDTSWMSSAPVREDSYKWAMPYWRDRND